MFLIVFDWLSWVILDVSNFYHFHLVTLRVVVVVHITFIFFLLSVVGSNSSLVVFQSLPFCSILQYYSVHHLHRSSSTVVVVHHSVHRNVSPLSVESKRGHSMRVYVHVLIILSIPPFIVKVQQILPILSFYHQLNRSFAPNMLGVAYVKFVSSFYKLNSMWDNPFFVFLGSLLPSFKIIRLS